MPHHALQGRKDFLEGEVAGGAEENEGIGMLQHVLLWPAAPETAGGWLKVSGTVYPQSRGGG